MISSVYLPRRAADVSYNRPAIPAFPALPSMMVERLIDE